MPLNVCKSRFSLSLSEALALPFLSVSTLASRHPPIHKVVCERAFRRGILLQFR